MKKHFITLSLCLFLCFTAIAQSDKPSNKPFVLKGVTYVKAATEYHQFPDSIRIEFPEQHGLVVFSMNEIAKNTSHITSFPEQLKGWLKEIANSVADTGIPQDVSVTIKNTDDHRIVLKEKKERITSIVSQDNKVMQLLPPGWDITISSGKEKIYVYAQTFKELEIIAQQNFQFAVDKITSEVSAHPMGRKSLVSRMIFQDNKIQYSDMAHRSVSDFLDLGIGAGFGFLSDKFYPELHAAMRLRFSDKHNHQNHNVTLLYSNMFFSGKRSDGSNRSDVNSFLSLSWNKNMSSTKGTPLWAGVGAGLLIHREGDVFKGNTAKFFINTTFARFTVNPEIYLTNGYKDFSYGLKLSYSF